ncbi:hypothetical protein BJ875DRAFT_381324 [Amylocarpus encephaloides]|uniref:Tse2 ADP-ribosyltransferase toxin domain-containing protein n=1 Tax=Amylocarpus encephaloides TaxID=45428 RepID=A0A9P7YEB6_9HELO|nr:hypothetical protein BJ875DRAFT_381324 [Amylocarpus encephaloides]
MQELTRMHYDHYLDAVESSAPTADPHYLCLPKGTSIPSSLILFRERKSRLSLQPSHPVPLTSAPVYDKPIH